MFLGYFGGRDKLSRAVMLWGAPMCFILQARPAKVWLKTLFYAMSDPPGLFLSLLPAPQQAILSLDEDESYEALYQPGGRRPVAGEAGGETESDEEEDDEDDEAEYEEEEE